MDTAFQYHVITPAQRKTPGKAAHASLLWTDLHAGSKISPVTGPSYPQGSGKVRFRDYVKMFQDGCKVVSLTNRPLLPQEILLVLISVVGRAARYSD